MIKEIEIDPKYQPLYEILEGLHPNVDTVIVTGGRGSAKSFNIGMFSAIALVQYQMNILYTRYTNVSIVDSVKPEVDDKIELLNYQNYVNNTSTHIERGKNRIAFKGIKTGSKKQTANLKSLSGFNVFVVDEAEEIPDYETFEKVFLSIRSKDKQNITILILNPTTVHHWIFKHFYKANKLKGGDNTIIDNVMYIHTSYLDVKKEYLAKNIVRYYEKLAVKNPKHYKNIVSGGWVTEIEGRVFNDWKTISYSDFVKIAALYQYSIDFGAHDPMAVIEWKFVKHGEYDYHLYVHERYYKSENETRAEMSETIRENYKKEDGGILLYIMNLLNIEKHKILLCDSGGGTSNFRSNDFKIKVLNQNGYGKAIPAPKKAGSIDFGVQILKNITVYYTKESENIEYEYENYSLAEDRLSFIEGKYKDVDNHTIDAIRNIAYYLYLTGIIRKSL